VAVNTEKKTENTTQCADNAHLRTAALRAYNGHHQHCLRTQRILACLPLVRKVAQRVVSYLKPPLSFEDLISAGTVGLVKAARDFDPSRNASFQTYAYIRIKGAILDELRCFSLPSAGLNRRIRQALKTARKMLERTGSAPAETDLAKELGITVESLYRLLEQARAQHFVSVDARDPDGAAVGELLASPKAAAADTVEKAELVDKLADAIHQLAPKQRQVVLLYYNQQLTMKQIAEVLGVTESRVSQLHAAALFSLRLKLKWWTDG